MVLVDVQKDQRMGVEELVERETGEKPTLVPTVRARMMAINGVEIDLDKTPAGRERGRLGREYVATYRSELGENETLLSGKFWDSPTTGEPEVSIEQSLQGTGGMDVGSTIAFDIQGREIVARITSVRQVDWLEFADRFYVDLPSGATRRRATDADRSSERTNR